MEKMKIVHNQELQLLKNRMVVKAHLQERLLIQLKHKVMRQRKPRTVTPNKVDLLQLIVELLALKNLELILQPHLEAMKIHQTRNHQRQARQLVPHPLDLLLPLLQLEAHLEDY